MPECRPPGFFGVHGPSNVRMLGQILATVRGLRAQYSTVRLAVILV